MNEQNLNSAGLGVMRSPTKEEEKTRLLQVLHDFRKEIDVNIVSITSGKITEVLYNPDYKIAREQATIKLREAKMWVGKMLEFLGSELPKEFQDKAE